MDLSPIYAVDVGTFRDANADGAGDLRGVIEKLDHVERLGAGTLWLLPFFTSPRRDNGYDVSDFLGIEPRAGTFGDFVDLVAEAHRRGLRIFIDLVLNHTSDEHAWFRAARGDPDGAFRNYYHWTDSPPPLADQRDPVFPDRVPSVWSWDEAVGAFFFHQFYPFQPTLNHENPAVNDEIRRIIAFWQQLGVDGFRIDAAGHLGEPTLEPGSEAALDILRRYRAYASDGAVLLGEADLPPDRLASLLGRDRLGMLFDFIGNAHLYLAFALESAEPIVQAHELHGDAPDGTAWVHFLRNLDEIDLERLAPDDFAIVMDRFAPRPSMRIFGRGIRRRLAPILDGDGRRIRLAFSILLAHPGAPMIVYGDEIGMGDDQALPERRAVRTAMQWTGDPGAGFSEAPPEQLEVPIVRDERYGAERVNVADQEADPDSLLAFVRAALAAWRETADVRSPEGGHEMSAIADGRVLATCTAGRGGSLVTLHNLAGRPVRFPAPWQAGDAGDAAVVLGESPARGDGRIELPPFGFCWVRIPR